jgi:hypothetical protein
VLDLGPRARIAFALLFFAAELALVISAPWRVDRVFGFEMFNGSSDIRIELARRVRGRGGALIERALPGGVWSARDAHGQTHDFRWDQLVRGTRLTRLDAVTHAKDGVDAQLFHLQRALDYAAAHIPGDAQTVALVAHVHAVRNGHTPVDAVLQSRPR